MDPTVHSGFHPAPGSPGKLTDCSPSASVGRGIHANFPTVSAFPFVGWLSLERYELTLLTAFQILALNSVYLLPYVKDDFF